MTREGGIRATRESKRLAKLNKKSFVEVEEDFEDEIKIQPKKKTFHNESGKKQAFSGGMNSLKIAEKEKVESENNLSDGVDYDEIDEMMSKMRHYQAKETQKQSIDQRPSR